MKKLQRKQQVGAADEQKSGKDKIQIGDLSLPKGGGSLHGLNMDFCTDLKMDVQKGISSFTIPVIAPEGRNDGLKLALNYHSTSGNGIFGQGFSLDLPWIARKTECRIPVYSDEADVFVSSEYGELLLSEVQESEEEKSKAFCPIVEKAFCRIRLIQGEQNPYWVVTEKDGTRHRYGADENSVVADPEDKDRIFMWKLSDSEDAKGNKVVYEYRETDPTREINKIQYANYREEDGTENYAYEIGFSYLQEREDVFKNYRSGFCLETKELCGSVTIYQNVLNRHPLREYQFTYQSDKGISLLSEVRVTGIQKMQDGSLKRQKLPPLTLSYSGCEKELPDFRKLDAGGYALPSSLAKGNYQFVDLYGDGIPGILYNDDKVALYYEPMDIGVYEKPRVLEAFPMEGSGGEPYYRLLSLNGDERYDMVVSLPGRQGFYEHREGGFAPFRPFMQGLDLYGETELTDVQGDHLSHAVKAGENGLMYYPSLKTQGFKLPVTGAVPDDFPSREETGSARRVCYLDILGDGLKHRVLIENGSVLYYPNLGYGCFGHKRCIENAPIFSDEFDAHRLFFADLDGSGTADFIYAYQDYVEVFFNRCGVHFEAGWRIPLPETYSSSDFLNFADITGTGCQSLIFTKMRADVVHYFLDLYGERKPYLLEKLDNHMGTITCITYGSSALACLKDKKQGDPWESRITFPIPLVTCTCTEDSVIGRKVKSVYHYRNPHFDIEKRKYCGFEYVECIQEEDYADGNARVSVCGTRRWFHTGAQQSAEEFWKDQLPDCGEDAGRALEGRLIREELYEENAPTEALKVVQHAYIVEKRPEGSYYSNLIETYTYEYGKGAEEARITQKAIIETDGFGNVTKEAEVFYGRESPAAAGQEQTEIIVTLRSFINIREKDWLIGVKAQEQKLQITCKDSHFTVETLKDRIDGSAKLLAWEKWFYWNEEGTGAMDLFSASVPALVHHKQTAVLLEADLHRIYERQLEPEILEKECGFLLEEGIFWNRGLVSHFFGKNNYHQLNKLENSFIPEGDTLFFRTEWEYDRFWFLPVHRMEYAGKNCINHTSAQIDYAHLKYCQIIDCNGNLSRAEYDGFGNMILISHPKQKGEDGFTIRYSYDFDRYETRRSPVSCTEEFMKESGEDGVLRCRVLYFDGAGQSAECLIREHRRWVVTEKKMKDSQGKTLVSYPSFEKEDRDYTPFASMVFTSAGLPIRTCYDVLGRMTRTEHPKTILPEEGHAVYLIQRRAYGAWDETCYNENDTIMESEYAPVVLSLNRDSQDAQAAKAAFEGTIGLKSIPVHFEKDVFGRNCLELLEETKEGMVAASYGYDVEGRPLWGGDPRLREQGLFNISYSYDFQGNLLRSDSVDTGVVWRVYDCCGNVRFEMDKNKNHKQYSYDFLNRLVEKRVSGHGLVEKIEYGEGVPEGEEKNLRGTIYRHFDQAGVEVIESRNRFGKVTAKSRRLCRNYDVCVDWDTPPALEEEEYREKYGFDVFGNEVLRVNPEGTRCITAYNERELAESVIIVSDGKERVVIPQASYHPSGLPAEVLYENGVTVCYRFCSASKELYEISAVKKDGGLIQRLRYCYDAAGNLFRLTNCLDGSLLGETTMEKEMSFDYSYDRFGRLLTAEGHQWGSVEAGQHGDTLEVCIEEYKYDRGSNLIELRHQAPSESFFISMEIQKGSNRLEKTGEQFIEYDANGNQLITIDGKQATWNWDNQLTAVKTKAEGEEELEYYVYDYSGSRVRKVVKRMGQETEVTEKRYFGRCEFEHVSLASESDHSVLRKLWSCHISLDKNLCAVLYHELLTDKKSTRFLLENHTASVCLELDEAGKAVTYEEYYSFGKTALTVGIQEDLERKVYRYGSKEKDKTGLYYFETRYYDQFRFLSGDSLSFIKFSDWQSLNLYAYCRNNPEKYTDETGEVPGQHFTTMDAAALDFGRNYNQQSILGNQEIGAFLYSAVQGGVRYFSYETPFTDRRIDSVNPSSSRRRGQVSGRIQGVLHTHGAYDRHYASEFFSSADRNYSRALTRQFGRNIPIYVATPGGRFKKFDPSMPLGARTSTLSRRMPHDRRAKVQFHRCGRCAN